MSPTPAKIYDGVFHEYVAEEAGCLPFRSLVIVRPIVPRIAHHPSAHRCLATAYNNAHRTDINIKVALATEHRHHLRNCSFSNSPPLKTLVRAKSHGIVIDASRSNSVGCINGTRSSSHASKHAHGHVSMEVALIDAYVDIALAVTLGPQPVNDMQCQCLRAGPH